MQDLAVSVIDVTTGSPSEIERRQITGDSMGFSLRTQPDDNNGDIFRFKFRLMDGLGQMDESGVHTVSLSQIPNEIRFVAGGDPAVNPDFAKVAEQMPLRVLVTDSAARPVPEQEVNWFIKSGPGGNDEMLLGSSITDQNGYAIFDFDTDRAAGEYSVQASLAIFDSVYGIHDFELLTGEIQYLVFGHVSPVVAGHVFTFDLQALDSGNNPVYTANEEIVTLTMPDPGFNFGFADNLTITRMLNNEGYYVEQAAVRLINGKATVPVSAAEKVNDYPVAISFADGSGLFSMYDHDGLAATPLEESETINVRVLPETPHGLAFSQKGMTNKELGDPERLEVGETSTVELILSDRYGNLVTTMSDSSGVRRDANFLIDVSLSGNAQSEGNSGTVTLDMQRGTAELPVTDDTVEEVEVSVVGVDPLPGSLNIQASINLNFLKMLPAISQTEFASVTDNINPPLVLNFTEAVEETGSAPVSVKLDGTVVDGSVAVDGATVSFTAANNIALNSCYTVDTTGSTLVGVAAEDKPLVQNLTVCSPLVAIPQQGQPYLLAGTEKAIDLLFGDGVDRQQITSGEANLDGVTYPFAWETGAFTTPDLSGSVADGTLATLSLAGVYSGTPLRLANAITTRILLSGHDFDGDGLPNELEINLGLDPTKMDSDGNGIADGDEDQDGDGLINAEELALGTALDSADSDGDGLSDYEEVKQYQTDPLAVDSDNDGVDDGLEVNTNNNPNDASGDIDLGAWVTGLTVTPESVELTYSRTNPPVVNLQVTASVTVDGNTYQVDVTKERFGTTYSSAENAIAQPMADGAFQIATDGETTISATLAGIKASSALTVLPSPEEDIPVRLAQTNNPQKLYSSSDNGGVWLEVTKTVPFIIKNISVDGIDIPIIKQEGILANYSELPVATDPSMPGVVAQLLGSASATELVSGDVQGGNESYLPGDFGEGAEITVTEINEAVDLPALIHISFIQGVPDNIQGMISVTMDTLGAEEETVVEVQVPVEIDPQTVAIVDPAMPDSLDMQVGEALDIPLTIQDPGFNNVEVQYLLDGELLQQKVVPPYPAIELGVERKVTPNVVETFYDPNPDPVLNSETLIPEYNSGLNFNNWGALVEWSLLRFEIADAGFYRITSDNYETAVNVFAVTAMGDIDWDQVLLNETWGYSHSLYLPAGNYVIALGPRFSRFHSQQTTINFPEPFIAWGGVMNMGDQSVTILIEADPAGGTSGSELISNVDPAQLEQAQKTFKRYLPKRKVDLTLSYQETNRAYILCDQDIGNHTLTVKVLEHTVAGGVRESIAGYYTLGVAEAEPAPDCGLISVETVKPQEGEVLYVRNSNGLTTGDFTNFTPVTIKASSPSGIASVEWSNAPATYNLQLPETFPVGLPMVELGKYISASDDQYKIEKSIGGGAEVRAEFKKPFGLHVDRQGTYRFTVDHQNSDVTSKLIIYSIAGWTNEVAMVEGDSVYEIDLAAGDYYLYVATEYAGDGLLSLGISNRLPVYQSFEATVERDYSDYANFKIMLEEVSVSSEPSYLEGRYSYLGYRLDTVDNAYFTLANPAAYLAIQRTGLTELEFTVTSNCGAVSTHVVPIEIVQDPAPQISIQNSSSFERMALGETKTLQVLIEDAGRDVSNIGAFLLPRDWAPETKNYVGQEIQQTGTLLSGYALADYDMAESLAKQSSLEQDSFSFRLPTYTPPDVAFGDYDLRIFVRGENGEVYLSEPFQTTVGPSSMPPHLFVESLPAHVPAGEDIPVSFNASKLGSINNVTVTATGSVQGGFFSEQVFGDGGYSLEGKILVPVAEYAIEGDLANITVTAEDSNGVKTSADFTVTVGFWGQETLVIETDSTADNSFSFNNVVVRNGAVLTIPDPNIKLNGIDIEGGSEVVIPGKTTYEHLANQNIPVFLRGTGLVSDYSTRYSWYSPLKYQYTTVPREYFTIPETGAYTIELSSYFNAEIYLFRDDGSLDSTDLIFHEANGAGSLLRIETELTAGDYLLAVGASQVTLSEAVSGTSHIPGRGGNFSYAISSARTGDLSSGRSTLELKDHLWIDQGAILSIEPPPGSFNQNDIDADGGSHGGDSVNYEAYDGFRNPRFPGGSSGVKEYIDSTTWTSWSGVAGGGSLHVIVPALTLNGTIVADGRSLSPEETFSTYTGVSYLGGGAGGSILVEAISIDGNGTIRANGGDVHNAQQRSGSGGRVAVYYDTYEGGLISEGLTLEAKAGTATTPGLRNGAGTVFTQQAAQQYGELYVDNGTDAVGSGTTTLRSIGKHSIADVITTAVGSRYQIYIDDPNGFWAEYEPAFWKLGARGLFVSLDAENVDAPLYEVIDNGWDYLVVESTEDLTGVEGNTMQGVIRLDKLVTTEGVRLKTLDRIHADTYQIDDYANVRGVGDLDTTEWVNLNEFSLVDGSALYTQNIEASSVILTNSTLYSIGEIVVSGDMAVVGDSKLMARKLTVDGNVDVVDASLELGIDEKFSVLGNMSIGGEVTSGSVVTVPDADVSSKYIYTLDLNVARQLSIAAGSIIDLDRKGYPGRYTVGFIPYYDQIAGSDGGDFTEASFAGAGSGKYNGINYAGGGLVRIKAEDLTVDGVIQANAANNYIAAAAGGGIHLDVTSLTGLGQIKANGGDNPSYIYSNSSTGSGGIVSVIYENISFTQSAIQAHGGKTSSSTKYQREVGAAGTVYLKERMAEGGYLVVDGGDGYNTTLPTYPTQLRSVGQQRISALTDLGDGIWRVDLADASLPIANGNDKLGVRGLVVDLDASDNDGPFYTITDNGDNWLEIDTSGTSLPDPASLNGKNLIGVTNLSGLTLKNGAKLKTLDRLVIADPSNVEIAAGTELAFGQMAGWEEVIWPQNYEINLLADQKLPSLTITDLAVTVKGRLDVTGDLIAVGNTVLSAEEIIVGGSGRIDGATVITSNLKVTGDPGSLDVIGTGKITVLDPEENKLYPLNLEVAGELYVGSNAVIDLDGKGYPDGYTVGFISNSGSTNAGGSHIGHGGGYQPSGNESEDLRYGDFTEARFAGAGGGYSAVYGYFGGYSGGGLVRIKAGDLTVDGVIQANGAPSSYSAAGGGIHLDVISLAGTGQIMANGGVSSDYSGSGGIISVVYDNISFDRTAIQANSGTRGYNLNDLFRQGASGTVYLKERMAEGGHLVVDGGFGGDTEQWTELRSVGQQRINGLTDLGNGTWRIDLADDGQPPIANRIDNLGVRGLVVDLNAEDNEGPFYPITDNGDDWLVIDTAGESLPDTLIDNNLIGVTRLSGLTLKNGARLKTLDRLVIPDPSKVEIAEGAKLVFGQMPGWEEVLWPQNYELNLVGDQQVSSLAITDVSVTVDGQLDVIGDLEAVGANAIISADEVTVGGSCLIDGATMTVNGRLDVAGELALGGANTVFSADEITVGGSFLVYDATVITSDIKVTGALGYLKVMGVGKIKVPDPEENKLYPLNLEVAGELYVGPDASIDLNGKGYPGGRTVNFISTRDNAGGSHSGPGGYYTYSSTSYLDSDSNYDDFTEALFAGSGGYGGVSYAGGGAVRITAGYLTVDGVIQANGAPSNYSAAGGGIHLDVGSLAGIGQITANGGDSTYYSGSGGIISIVYDNISFDQTAIQAYSGTRLYYPDYSYRQGASGTVYIKERSAEGGHLIVDGGPGGDTGNWTNLRSVGQHQISELTDLGDGTWRVDLAESLPSSVNRIDGLGLAGLVVDLNASDDEGPFYTITDSDDDWLTIDTGETYLSDELIGNKLIGVTRLIGLTIRNGAQLQTLDRLVISDPSQVEIAEYTKLAFGQMAGWEKMTWPENFELNLMADQKVSSLAITDMPVIVDGRLEVIGDLEARGANAIIRADEIIVGGNCRIDDATVITTGIKVTGAPGDLEVVGTGKITVPDPESNKLYPLNLEVAGEFYVGRDASIDLDGKGYPRDKTVGFSGSNYSDYYSYADGSYGGVGGGYPDGSVDTVYGDYTDVGFAGSGGNIFEGGGLLRVIASDLTVDGIIRANGSGSSSSYGSGAGGGINLDVGSLSGVGQIEANGGPAVYYTGSGGRISIVYDELAFTLENIQATGGPHSPSSTYGQGAPGTVYLNERTADTGHLLVDNGGNLAASGSTPIRSVGKGEIADIVGLGNGRWQIVLGARIPLNISRSGGITQSGEGSVYYYSFTVPFDYKYTIKVAGSFRKPAFHLFRDDGFLEIGDWITDAYPLYSRYYVDKYHVHLAKGKYIMAVSGSGDYFDAREAVYGENSNSYFGTFTISITAEGSGSRWLPTDLQYGWGIAGRYVDLDASTPEGPYYRIESNGGDDFVIQVPDTEVLDAGDLLGNELVGVHRFDKLNITGGASLSFGWDRVFVMDKVNSVWDLSSEIIAGEGSDLPVQQ
jgi:hypothetical protein